MLKFRLHAIYQPILAYLFNHLNEAILIQNALPNFVRAGINGSTERLDLISSTGLAEVPVPTGGVGGPHAGAGFTCHAVALAKADGRPQRLPEPVNRSV